MYYGCVVFENYTDENSYELHHDGERGGKTHCSRWLKTSSFNTI